METLFEQIENYNELMKNDDTEIKILDKVYTIKQLREIEEKYNLQLKNSSRINTLVFYDDILQYLGYGFIYYLKNIRKECDYLTKKEKNKLSDSLIKFMKRKDYDIFDFLNNLLKLSDNRIIELMKLYKMIYMWLIELSPASELINNLIKLNSKLDSLVIVFEHEILHKDQFIYSIKNQMTQLNNGLGNTPDIIIKSFDELKNKNNIFDYFFKNISSNKANNMIITLDGYDYLDYSINNEIKDTTLLIPHAHNGLSDIFLGHYILSEQEQEKNENKEEPIDIDINNTKIILYNEMISGYETSAEDFI